MAYNPYAYNALYNPYNAALQPPIAQAGQLPSAPNIAQSAANGGILWVQGEAGAKAYPVAAGNSLLLMDSEKQVFYIKSTDPSGMPQPLRRFVYHEDVADSSPAQSEIDTSLFVTHDELEKALAKLKPKTTKKKEVEENE